MSVAGEIRALLLSGEELSSSEVALQLKCSHGMLSYTVSRMKKDGYRFSERAVAYSPQARQWKVTGHPQHSTARARPDAELGGEHGVVEPRAGGLAVSTGPATPAARRVPLQTPVRAPSLPAIGSTVLVVLQALDPATGAVRIGVQGLNGDGGDMWVFRADDEGV